MVAGGRMTNAAGCGVIGGIAAFLLSGGFFTHGSSLPTALAILSAYAIVGALLFTLVAFLLRRAVPAAVPEVTSLIGLGRAPQRRGRARSWTVAEGQRSAYRRGEMSDSARIDPRLAGIRAALTVALPPASDRRFDDLLRKLEAA